MLNIVFRWISHILHYCMCDWIILCNYSVLWKSTFIPLMTLSSLTGFPGPWIEQQRRSSGSVRWAVASPESRNGWEGGVCRLVDSSDSGRPSVSASESKAPHSLVAVQNLAVGVAPATARYCCSRWERHIRHLWVRSFRKSLCAKCCLLSYLFY